MSTRHGASGCRGKEWNNLVHVSQPTLMGLLDDAALLSFEHQLHLADVLGEHSYSVDLSAQRFEFTAVTMPAIAWRCRGRKYADMSGAGLSARHYAAYWYRRYYERTGAKPVRPGD